MATALQILAGLLGLVLIAVGAVMFLLFHFMLRYFDRFWVSQAAHEGRQTVTDLAEKIPNPMVKRFVLKYGVDAGGKILVSLVRDAMKSRRRMGLYIAGGGIAAILFSSTAHEWLPLMFKTK